MNNSGESSFPRYYKKLSFGSNANSAFNWQDVYGPQHRKNFQDKWVHPPLGKSILATVGTTQEVDGDNEHDYVLDMPFPQSVVPRNHASTCVNVTVGSTVVTQGTVMLNSLAPLWYWAAASVGAQTNKSPMPVEIGYMRNHYKKYRVTSARVIYTWDHLGSTTSPIRGIMGALISDSPNVNIQYDSREIEQGIQQGALKGCYFRHQSAAQSASSTVDTGWIHILGQFQESKAAQTGPDVTDFAGELGFDNQNIIEPATKLFVHPYFYCYDIDGSGEMAFECNVKVLTKVLWSDPVEKTVEPTGKSTVNFG